MQCGQVVGGCCLAVGDVANAGRSFSARRQFGKDATRDLFTDNRHTDGGNSTSGRHDESPARRTASGDVIVEGNGAVRRQPRQRRR